MENEYEELKRKLQEVYDQAEEWYCLDEGYKICVLELLKKLL